MARIPDNVYIKYPEPGQISFEACVDRTQQDLFLLGKKRRETLQTRCFLEILHIII
jgi:hypothetical protein